MGRKYFRLSVPGTQKGSGRDLGQVRHRALSFGGCFDLVIGKLLEERRGRRFELKARGRTCSSFFAWMCISEGIMSDGRGG